LPYLFFIHLFSPSGPGKNLRQLERVFEKAQFREPVEPAKPRETSNHHSPEFVALEWSFKQALYLVYLRNGNVSEWNLSHIINKVLFSVPMPREDITVFREGNPPDSRTLEKRIQNMIKEKQ